MRKRRRKEEEGNGQKENEQGGTSGRGTEEDSIFERRNGKIEHGIGEKK